MCVPTIKITLQLFTCEFTLCLFLWGCQDLKYKILIKNKKLKPQIKAEDASGTEAEESVDEGEEDDEEDEEDEDLQTKEKFWSPRKAGSKKEVSQGKISLKTHINIFMRTKT